MLHLGSRLYLLKPSLFTSSAPPACAVVSLAETLGLGAKDHFGAFRQLPNWVSISWLQTSPCLAVAVATLQPARGGPMAEKPNACHGVFYSAAGHVLRTFFFFFALWT